MPRKIKDITSHYHTYFIQLLWNQQDEYNFMQNKTKVTYFNAQTWLTQTYRIKLFE